MSAAEEQHLHLRERFARIRRAKFFLRFMPRRARFHTYPVIGRFAAFARKRSYLWSFRSSDVRPAIYVGSIIAFLPILGIQVTVAFIMAVLLRRNVMVLVGLQFLTNPFTVVPAYYATYQVGSAIISHSGIGHSPPSAEETQLASARPADAPETPEIRETTPPAAGSNRLSRWTSRIGTEINALIIGGFVVGGVVGGIIDLIWVVSVNQAAAHRRKILQKRSLTTTTPPPPA